jgi:peptide methionine sulfoxide reductase MsrA
MAGIGPKRNSNVSKYHPESSHQFVRIVIYAERYHQQYLAKNPSGYCGIGRCGVPFKLAELPMGEKA